MTKKVMFVVVVLVLLAVPAVALAGDGGPEVGHYSDGFFQEVYDYSGRGPACYYGQDVRVVYDATNRWTYVLKNGDLRETLVQNGTAKVYDMEDNLLDERPFHVTERFFDAGMDVAQTGASPVGTVWYQVSAFSSDLEEYQYIWKIPGVYDFRIWNRGGEVSWGWTSGDCEGGDGWPPHPPHPFSE
jgi:hypothetical protein